jgi:hypothetical protein
VRRNKRLDEVSEFFSFINGLYKRLEDGREAF